MDAAHRDGPDRYPVDVRSLALQYSVQRFPDSPIKRVEADDLDGFEGALLPGETRKNVWGILYDSKQTAERARFTVAHELGHYLLHRDKQPKGFWCGEDVIVRREVEGIEKEADTFAAFLLMPLHDFRALIPPDHKPTLEELGDCARRYGVSLTAAILRWLEYTNRRSMLVVSNEGFARWAKASGPAFRSGKFIRTRASVFELPGASLVATMGADVDPTVVVRQSAGVWFDEPVEESCIASSRYEMQLTLLHLGAQSARSWHSEAPDEEDSFDRFKR
ncbi:ImmA/IrrE family metallo-endopeptidase [Devosia salina]|uniref:ImmA/IrrE family metallo-endopeptidase n=1 Tax=Devosia salina TaxID=2860336 RepID=A0ABX8WDT7_9HYPH|nr:ImmA/IrrE family metallo-endopeptidase [Devosia salina]QYO75602.1 ImmA/IrrE family metallo-endopeptidase [Devosia salina]